MPRRADAKAREKPSSDELRALAHLAAGSIGPHDNVKGLIGRAARVLGVSYRRAKSFWYAEADHVRAEEVARLRAERGRLLDLRIAQLEVELARHKRLLEQERHHAEAAPRVAGGSADGAVAAVVT